MIELLEMENIADSYKSKGTPIYFYMNLCSFYVSL